MFFIGSTNSRGTYYFWSKQSNGWITADLDAGKAVLHNKLALVRVVNEIDVVDTLADCGLGQDGDRWLVDGEELIPLLRDHAKELEVLMVLYQDGTSRPYGKLEQNVAKMLKKAKKKFGKNCGY